MLAAVLERDGQQRSATQARRQALADADHLALLHAIWTAETSPAREQRYRDLLAAVLPPRYHARPGPRDRWLWRTLRAAELAGLDPARVLANAVAERDLAGARDIPAVLDARIRNRTGSPVPLPPGPWSARVPAIADPERRAYVTEIAALMDARKQRLGEHAAACAPPWAVSALGPVPEHQAARLDWQRRAAAIAAWRELSGYHNPTDPIGTRTRRGRPGPAGRLARGPGRPRPGRRPGRTRHAGTACCCTCATPTPSRPPGRPGTSRTSSARSATPPGTPA